MNYKLIAYAGDFVSFLLFNLDSDMDKVNQVILFGSVARGEDDEGSDVDLFIDVLDENLEGRIKEIKEKFFESILIKKYWKLLGVKEEINCSVGKLKKWGDLQRSMIANGIVLYGKYKSDLKMKMESYYLFVVEPGKDRNRNVSVWRGLYGYVQKVGKKKYVKKGLVKEYGGKKLARGVFIIPGEHSQKMISFLKKRKFGHRVIPFWQEKD